MNTRRTSPRRLSALRPSLLLALASAIVLSLSLAGSSGAWVLNQAQLDDGTCGHNQQLGSDPTASSSATPWFLLYGDGTRASYNISIDGAPIGTFTVQDLFGDVCVHSTLPLSEGTHRLTGNEISPNSAGVVTPFTFSVDTVAPAAPSTPTIASFSDSGIKGDNTTMFPNPTLTGTTVPGLGVVLYDNGAAGIGGASSDSTGLWSARTTNLPDGIHPITTATLDTAGNKSTLSGSLPLRIDTTPPSGVLTNPTSGSTVNGSVNLTAAASDAVGVWKVVFQVDGVVKATVTAAPYSYVWDSASVANGAHTVAAVTTDNAGNAVTSSVSVTVANGVAASVPGAPSLDSAAAGSGSVTLSWSAPVSNGGSAITGYRIYRSSVSGGEVLLVSVGVSGSYVDSGLVNGATYYYQVSAMNSVGEGGRSLERSAVPVAALTVPGAPTITAATGGDRQVSLTWSAPGSNGGSAITGYRIYRSSVSGGEVLLVSVGVWGSYVDSGLVNGATYYYQVSAVNSVGESGRSVERSAVVPAAQVVATIPGAPTLTVATGGDHQVSLTWSAPGSNGGSAITGYRVYSSTASGSETLLTTVGPTTGYVDTTTRNNATYYYKVTAINAIGESAFSNERSATPRKHP